MTLRTREIDRNLYWAERIIIVLLKPHRQVKPAIALLQQRMVKLRWETG